MASEVVILNSDGEEEPIALDSDTWKCTKCTYDNPFTYLVCGVCAAEKTASSPSSSSHPRKKKKAAALSSAAAAIDLSAELGGTWTCTACTLINEGGSTCQACGVPRSGPTQPTGPSASAGAQAPAGARSKSRSNGGRASTSSGRGPLYTLDCGCAIPRDVAAAAAAHRLSPQSLPLRLSQLVHHFPCPTRDDSSAENAAKQPCMQQLSHRDLEALVGAAQVAALNRKFYDAACAVQETSHADKRSNGGNGSAVGASEEQQCCERLAGCIAALHAALTGEPPTGEASGAKGQPSGQPPHAHGHKHAPYGYKNRPPHHHQARLQQHKQSGVGYAGSSEQDVALRKRLGDQAAKRQQEDDARISLLMSQLRKELAALDSGAPFGAWLSLPVVAVLHGSPLAACLRFLLTNDSLMDVVVRHTVYHEALHLLGVLSRRQDLVPLLLQKADGDVLATFAPEAKAQRAQQEKRQGKRPLGDEPGKAGGRSAKLAKTDRNRAVPTHTEEKAPEPDPAHEGAVNGVDVDLEGSCWKALQAFHLQCELFMRSAQDLADAGSEEDMDTVGTVILVQETCSLVNEAVEAWRSLVAPRTVSPPKADESPDTDKAPQNGTAAGKGSGEAVEVTPAAKQQFVRGMKKHAFTMIDLVEKGSYYFRNALGQAPQGNAADRLRRLTKEISTLSTQLPVAWESSILVAVDNHRMDALRAIIFPPDEDTPYSNGCFQFDILLPPEYPNKPPKVQFMTTGGGKIRFGPNLYNCGKVCLSLLGTWSGPSWEPGVSSLLQVLISLQSMLLGEKDPYFLEPGYERNRNSAGGKAASEQYNVRQRYNTLQYSILPALIKAPWGFEEAVRLYYTSKAQVVKAQARAWAKMDKPSQLPAAHRGPMYGPSEGPVKTKEAAGAVVAAIDGLMREQEGR